MLESDIIIKKADKGNTLVVDVSFYRDKLVTADHLGTDIYCKANSDSDIEVLSSLKTLMNRYRVCLTDKEYDYIVNYDWKPSNLYALPKIHKCQEIIESIEHCNSSYLHMETPHSLKGRPVITGPASPT